MFARVIWEGGGGGGGGGGVWRGACILQCNKDFLSRPASFDAYK